MRGRVGHHDHNCDCPIRYNSLSKLVSGIRITLNSKSDFVEDRLYNPILCRSIYLFFGLILYFAIRRLGLPVTGCIARPDT